MRAYLIGHLDQFVGGLTHRRNDRYDAMITVVQIGKTARNRAYFCRCFKTRAATASADAATTSAAAAATTSAAASAASAASAATAAATTTTTTAAASAATTTARSS
ncbi:MAG: hypothetical protein ACTHKE_00780, partial [Sphingomicrobium sp.]